MASSENQGLHIALIILFMLFIVLSVTTFIFFGQSNSAYEQARVEKDKASQAEAVRTKLVEDVREYRTLIGITDEEIELDKVKDMKAEDMKAFASTLPPEKQVYRAAIEELAKSLADVQTKSAALADELNVVKGKNALTEEAANAKVAEAEKARDKANTELASEKSKFMEAQKKAEADKKELADQLAKLQTDQAAEVERLNKSIDEGKKSLTKAEETIKKLQIELASMRPGSFNVDDGEIRSVSPRNNTVVINLGANDALRRQITFFVHSPSSSPTDLSSRKGTIEVTEILGEHLAEARIVDDTLKNPILPGDKIFTSLWDPGRREHFAIIGRVDLDGDGIDNRDRLRSMITLSGGVIDAEVDNDGKVTGKLDVSTRYLIEGDVPPKAKPAADKLLTEARLLGVERIGLDKFLDYIGWKANSQVVRFGTNGNAETYRQRLPDGGAGKSSEYYTDLFRKRTPPVDYKPDPNKSTNPVRGGAPTSIKF
jgi:hypothetical protein